MTVETTAASNSEEPRARTTTTGTTYMTQRIPLLLTLAALFTTVSADAQPSITGNDFLNLRGKSATLVDADLFPGTMTVNVGSAGANQTWDFSTLSVTGEAYTRYFVDPANTPFAGDFPGANFGTYSTETDGENTIGFYGYNFVDNSGLVELGYALDYGDSTFSFVEPDPAMIDLPVMMNSSWLDLERDTLSFGTTSLISIDSTLNVVDAWGTLTLPWGSMQVLRLRSDDLYISNTYVSGVLAVSDTTRSISYEWVSPEHFVVLSIESAEDETNPNFTEATWISVVTAITTDVAESDAGDGSTPLTAVYPNPFNDQLSIDIDVAHRAVDLAVFDVLGRRVRTLPAGTNGAQQITWDGRTEDGARAAAGIYLIRLQADNQVVARQVVLTR